MNQLCSIVRLFFVISIAMPFNHLAAKEVAPATVKAIQEVIDGLDQFYQDQTQAGIQDPNLSYAMRKALVLANLLFNATGQLKTHLNPIVKSYFVPNYPQEYEQNIGRVLDQLTDSWQPFFDTIKKPVSSNKSANLVLRALFSLSPQDPLTDRHAKVAVLAALFAPVNQGPVGDCFAVSDLIRDHNEYLQHSIKDYAQIVQAGFLTRRVNTRDDHFFFLPILADNDCSHSFSINSSGDVLQTPFSLLQIPGFAAASRLMQGEQVPHLLQDITAILFQGSSKDSIQITALQVIDALAEAIIANQNGLNKDDLMLRGLYGFSSLTNQPVLRATESAFAAMAEDRPQDSTRGNINDCVAQAMASQWTFLGATSHDFQVAFTRHFNDSYRLIYNLNIPLAQVSADGSSTDGGFQLYQRDHQSTVLGTRIATPEAFKQLVLNAITLTSSQLSGSQQTSAIVHHLNDFIANGTFLRDALWAYDSANQQESDPVNHYQKLSRTPMQSCDGDNPYEVDDIDTGYTFDNNVQTFSPKNPQDLVQWCLDLSKKAPAGLLPMNSPQHAFNFVPAISDLKAYQKSGVTSLQWIKQMLIIPGMKIATRLIDSSTQTRLANAMFNIISEGLPDPTHYQYLVAQLSEKNLTIQKYAQQLLEGILSLLVLDASQANQLAIYLDSVLLQVLPENDLRMIQLSSIRFAFTNWNEGSKNIYFCGYFNPRTAQVGFGNIEEDKTNLQPMDELAWINSLQWDVDCHPFVPALLATGT